MTRITVPPRIVLFSPLKSAHQIQLKMAAILHRAESPKLARKMVEFGDDSRLTSLSTFVRCF
jgi:hypothetical protein